MLPALTFVAVLTLLVCGCQIARRRGRNVFRIDQFAPAAPLVGRLPEDRDTDRALRDLDAARSRREAPPSRVTVRH
ncbi:hypothetical protein ACWDUM_26960 [Rhodococcus sp. NPDC003322]